MSSSIRPMNTQLNLSSSPNPFHGPQCFRNRKPHLAAVKFVAAFGLFAVAVSQAQIPGRPNPSDYTASDAESNPAPLAANSIPNDSHAIENTAATSHESQSERGPEENLNKPTFWGAGVGLVFSSIPISSAKFVAPFTEIYYSWYLNDPNESLRTAVSLGLYGFGMVLPVPKVSAEMFIGKPTRDIQGKFGVGGFYDIAVGGHGGFSLETGVRLANKYDISFVTVPFGSDSKRDYLEFMGLRKEDEPAAKKPFVQLPYFGIFCSVAF